MKRLFLYVLVATSILSLLSCSNPPDINEYYYEYDYSVTDNRFIDNRVIDNSVTINYGEVSQTVDNRIALWVDTDVGGDIDDQQTVEELILLSDLFQLVGISASPTTHIGGRDFLVDIIRDVNIDQLRNKGYTEYPTTAELVSITHEGATREDKGSVVRNSGTAAFIAAAHKFDTLYVSMWGKATFLASAVAEDPSIIPKLCVNQVAAWNRQQDPLALSQLEAIDGLCLTSDDATHRVTHTDKATDEYQWTSKGFYETHIQPYSRTYPTAPNGGRKSGDFCFIGRLVGYIVDPDFSDSLNPSNDSWCGSYKRTSANKWVDLDGDPVGNAQTNKLRSLKFLAERFKRYGEIGSSDNCTTTSAMGNSLVVGGTHWSYEDRAKNNLAGGFIGKLARDSNCPIVNYAQDGETLLGMRRQAMDIPDNTKQVIFMGGLNDILGYTGTSPVVPLSQMEAVMRQIILLSPPSADIYLVGLVGVEKSLAINRFTSLGWSKTQAQYDQDMASFNLVLQTIASEEDRLHYVAPPSGFNRLSHTVDGIHPNTAGYSLIAGTLSALLE